MKKYIPSTIEPKWQKKWREDGLYLTNLAEIKNKYYVLVELPYTSGDLHMGHWFTFTMGDILARFKKRLGFNVLFPNGFDAFGLPAENAAIKQKIHPRDWTYGNIERMRAQFETLGTSIDWTKTMVACDPKYYKWNQWVFLKMLEIGSAYRGRALSNWCPNCQTVLANENVELGRCWRCGTEVITKEIEQWFFKITDYAERLLWQNPPQADWPKPLREGQNNWIGKSEGMEIDFPVIPSESAAGGERGNLDLVSKLSPSEIKIATPAPGSVRDRNDNVIKVYTVFPETIFGVTYMVLAPEHPLVGELTTDKQKIEVQNYIAKSKKKSELERTSLDKAKTGVFTGSYCINPVNKKSVPIWIADYVIGTYGTGAVMGVPGSDHRDYQFAKKYDLEIIKVIGRDKDDHSEIMSDKDVLEEGWLINSEQFNRLQTPDPAREKIKDWMEEKDCGKRTVQYHLHDWSISRQRYWGTPIPIIYCDQCGTVPVPEKDLPVELPYQVDYAPKGKPPLATAEEWVNTECPKCGGPAKREVETMDTFVDSAWYFFRYLDPENDQQIFDKKLVEDWMPLEIYIGGPEHTLGHALYSRFFTMVLKDLGVISFDEYAKKRVHHGTILGPDGSRMSKSQGNVVNPDEEVKNYGADAIRIYLMFLGPFDIVTAWNPDGVNGAYHFLQRVWSLCDKVVAIGRGLIAQETNLSSQDLKMMHKTIKKVTEDIEGLKYNTAIASLMEWLNYLSKKGRVSREEYKTLLLLLAPFAPHITEELWAQIGEKYSIHQHSWPKFDNKFLEEDEISIAVQINGKVRETLMIQKEMINNKEVVEKMAKELPRVKKFLHKTFVKKVIYVQGKIISFVTSR